MEGLRMDIILSIVGLFGTLALSINAYFLRGIFQDLGAVKIKLAELGVHSNSKEKRIEKLEKNEEEIFKRLNELERRI